MRFKVSHQDKMNTNLLQLNDLPESDKLTNGNGLFSLSSKVWADKAVNAKVEGTGNIRIYGNPETVEKQISGIGKITVEKE